MIIKQYPISIEEESAIDALGGVDGVCRGYEQNLREHGLTEICFPERNGSAFVADEIM